MDNIFVIKVRAEEVARLQTLRKLKTIGQLANKAGLSRQRVSEIINGEDVSGVKLGTINQICQALSEPGNSVKIEDILIYEPDGEEQAA